MFPRSGRRLREVGGSFASPLPRSPRRRTPPLCISIIRDLVQFATHVAATVFRTKGTVSAQSTPSRPPGFLAPTQNRFRLQDLPAVSLRSGRNLIATGAASAAALPRSHRAISAVRRHVVSPFLSAAAITRCRRNQFPAVEASHVWGGSPTSSKLSCGERNGRTLACCLPAFRVGLCDPPLARPGP